MMSMVWTGKQTTFGPIAPNPPDEGPDPPFLMPDVPYGHDPFFLTDPVQMDLRCGSFWRNT